MESATSNTTLFRQPGTTIDLLKVTASALIPLMIGVFTLVMALQEHAQGRDNRLNDLSIANEQREQQIKLEDARRAQDANWSEQNRQKDIKIAADQREQDLTLADALHKDTILGTYFNEMGVLLLDHNYTLDTRMRLLVVRPKTLTTLRQLDPARKTLLIKYLYESSLISADSEGSRIDLKDADLTKIDLSKVDLPNSGGLSSFPDLSLPGTDLTNATMDRCHLSFAVFERALMSGVSFRGAIVSGAKFHRAMLAHADLTDANTAMADFSRANLSSAIISDEQLHSALSISQAVLPNGTIAPNKNIYEPNGIFCRFLPCPWEARPHEDAIRCAPKATQSECNFFKVENDTNIHNASMSLRMYLSYFWEFIDMGHVKMIVHVDLYTSGQQPNGSDFECRHHMYDDDNVKLDSQSSVRIRHHPTLSGWYTLTQSTIFPEDTRMVILELIFVRRDTIVRNNIRIFLEHQDWEDDP